MKPALTKVQWERLHIVDSGDISRAGRGAAMITYVPKQHYGAGPFWRVAVVVNGVPRKPDQLFPIRDRADRLRQLAAAKTYADVECGLAAWERDVFGGWHPEGTMRRAAER